MLSRSLFYSKTVFGRRTAKSQPIWIKFYTHIVVRSTLVGWLRPRSARGRLQATPERLFFSVILVTHPKSHNRDDGSPRFRRQTIKVEVSEDWCYREKFRNFVVWAEPDKKTTFISRFGVSFDCPAHSLQETVLPQTNGTDGKLRLCSMKVCLLLVWRVCDQVFGRYRALKGAEKWSRNHHENRQTYKIHWFQKMLFFSIYDEKWRSYRGKPFQNSGVTRRLWTLGSLELTLVVNTSF